MPVHAAPSGWRRPSRRHQAAGSIRSRRHVSARPCSLVRASRRKARERASRLPSRRSPRALARHSGRDLARPILVRSVVRLAARALGPRSAVRALGPRSAARALAPRSAARALGPRWAVSSRRSPVLRRAGASEPASAGRSEPLLGAPSEPASVRALEPSLASRMAAPWRRWSARESARRYFARRWRRSGRLLARPSERSLPELRSVRSWVGGSAIGSAARWAQRWGSPSGA
jgi:hypothetical protein